MELLDELRGPPDEGRQLHVAQGRADVDPDQALVALSGVLLDVVLRQPPIQQEADGRVRPRRLEGVSLGQQLGAELLRLSHG